MRKFLILLVAAWGLAAVGIAQPAPSPDDLLKDEKHFFAQSQKEFEGARRPDRLGICESSATTT